MGDEGCAENSPQGHRLESAEHALGGESLGSIERLTSSLGGHEKVRSADEPLSLCVGIPTRSQVRSRRAYGRS